MGPRSTGDLIPPTLRQTPTTSLPRPMPDLTRLYTKDPWAESSDDEDLGSPFFATPSHRLVVSRRPGVPGQWSNSPVHASSSVSPITMSAQKMSRAMQVRVEMSTCAVQGWFEISPVSVKCTHLHVCILVSNYCRFEIFLTCPSQ